jgi:hypothetical protein
MCNRIIVVFATIVTLCGANLVSAAGPESVAQKCAQECPKCRTGYSNSPGGPGQPGSVSQNQAVCLKQTDTCINECINRANQGNKQGNSQGNGK